jgi:hypothetical protein
MLHDFGAELGQRRAAARRAAGPAQDDRLAERVVELVDERPRAAIRHLHRAAGRRDRSGFGDQFEQPDLSRSERALVG